MKRRINQKGQKRLTDSLSFRTRQDQRDYLEQYASERGKGICDAARELLDLGIAVARMEA